MLRAANDPQYACLHPASTDCEASLAKVVAGKRNSFTVERLILTNLGLTELANFAILHKVLVTAR